MSPLNQPPIQSQPKDVTNRDAQVVFDAVWSTLLDEVGEDNMRFPKEFILLGGAPGAGKGTQTDFIRRTRGLTCPPIVVSDLLNSPEAKKIKDAGEMVGDSEVIELVFREMLKDPYKDGAVVDGFPRTTMQVECFKLLVSRINELWRAYHETPKARFFRKPIIHVVILYIEQSVSIARQMQRGMAIIEHNREVEASGEGELIELRKTDLDEKAAKRRYTVFKEQTWDALKSLRKHFFYHFINAQGSIREVEQNILNEMQYQSSLELDPLTYSKLRHIPLSDEIVLHARQELVNRLDEYALVHRELFDQVLEFIQEKVMPIVIKHAITGLAMINTEESLLESPLAMAMLIDVFSERGFHAVVDIHLIEIPETFYPHTGHISCRTKKVYRIQIRFQGSEIRR